MILDAYESPTRRLSYVVPFISNFEVFYVKIYRTLQSFHTDNLAIRASLGMRIDACKSSTLKLSHVSKFELKFALVADLLVFEDRHRGHRLFAKLNLGTPSATRRNWPALALSEIKPRPRPLRLVQSH